MKIRIVLPIAVLAIAMVIYAKAVVKIEDLGRAVDLATLRGPSSLLIPESEISWPVSSPDSQGIDGQKLAKINSDLAGKNTSAFLLLRNGFLLHEWYEPGRAAEDRHSLAASAKGIVAGLIVLIAAQEDWMQPSDRVSAYIPQWESDPWKSQVTIHQLASHRSGVEDLWGGDYTHDRRFDIALNDAKLLFEPGSHQSYSGTAFYVLAKAIATRLSADSQPDIARLYDERIMVPLGIPYNSYQISYGDSYQEDGLDLYAIGSGGRFAPRAIARVAQLVLNRGNWRGEQLLHARTMDMLLGDRAAERLPAWEEEIPIPNLGWWLNTDGFFPSLPCDAVVAVGNGLQIVLVIPSLNLVLVRNGAGFNQDGQTKWSAMEDGIFRPLMAALKVPGSDSTSQQSGEIESTSLGCGQREQVSFGATLIASEP